MVDTHAALRVGLRPINPLFLWVDGLYGSSESKGSGHSGTGFGGSAGAGLVWPGESLRPALSAQLSTQTTVASNTTSTNSTNGETETQTEERSTSSHWLVHLHPMLVWGSADQGATLWFGSELTPWGTQTLDMKTDDVALSLRPDQRIGLVLGAELRSDALGMPGRRQSYLTAGAQ
ncbi:MAG: hypothetical protein ACI9VR_004475, partial [Cognaticolwellia sp.]